jgi:hypothetical protein
MKTEIEYFKALKELVDSVDAEIILYRNNAFNIVVPNTINGKPLTIMTPEHQPRLENIKRATRMLQDHIDKNPITTEHYKPDA